MAPACEGSRMVAASVTSIFMFTEATPKTTATRTGTPLRTSSKPLQGAKPCAAMVKRYTPKASSDARYLPSAGRAALHGKGKAVLGTAAIHATRLTSTFQTITWLTKFLRHANRCFGNFDETITLQEFDIATLLLAFLQSLTMPKPDAGA